MDLQLIRIDIAIIFFSSMLEKARKSISKSWVRCLKLLSWYMYFGARDSSKLFVHLVIIRELICSISNDKNTFEGCVNYTFLFTLG